MNKIMILIACLFIICFGEDSLDSTHVYIFENSEWILAQRQMYTYPITDSTMLTMYAQQEGEWIVGGVQSWSVNEHGDMIYFTYEIAGMMLVKNKITNTYEYGKLVEAVISTNGVDTERETYTYEADNLVEALSERWTGTEWENMLRITHTYSDNRKTETLQQEWDDDNWQNMSKTLYFYEGDKLTYMEMEDWEEDAWVKAGKTVNSYNNLDQISEVLYSDWNGTEYEQKMKHVHFYGGGGVNVSNEPALPDQYSLYNYPNPFNPKTNINFKLPEEEFISIKIYDILGNHIKTLTEKRWPAGNHNIIWNARNKSNLKVPSGIYIYILKSQNYFAAKRCLLVK